MKKLHIFGLAAVAMLASCSQNDYNEKTKADSDRENEYLHNWIKRFNVPDKAQDWCMLRAVSAEIHTASLGEGVTTRIYSADPATGGNVLAVAQRDGSIRFDIRKGIDRVFGEVIDAEGNTIAAGMYDISGGKVCIDGSASEGSAPGSRYAHDETNGGSWFNAMIACEDLGSAADSDFDFNDIVFGLHRVAGTNALQITPMAAGGILSATISITVGDQTHQIGDSHDLIKPGNAGKMLNTHNPFLAAGETVTIEVPESWTIADAWTQQKFVITVNEKGTAYDIKSPAPGTAPKMILLDGDWYWPVENKAIDKAYHGFTAWAEGTGDKTDWVDNYTSLDDVVAWDISKVAANWFSAVSTGSTYTAKIDNSTTATINSGARYYMNPATSTANMFSGRNDLTSVNITGDHFNTASVTSTENMFRGCTGLTEIDLSGWNTSSLTDIDYMLIGTTSLNTLTLDNWDLSKITSSNGVFSSNSSELTPLKTFNINNAKLINILGGNLTSSILWNVYNSVETINARNCEIATDNIDGMFSYLTQLNTIDLSGCNASRVTSAQDMFKDCSSLKTLNLSGFDVSNLTDASEMFRDCSNLQSVGMTGWQTSSLENVDGMFQGCVSLETLDLSNWNTSSLTNITHMFSNTTSLKTLTLNGWDLSNIDSSDGVFSGVSGSITPLKTFNINNAKLKNIIGGNSTNRLLWNVHNSVETINANNCEIVTDNIDGMFSYLQKLKNISLSGCNASRVTSAKNMFYNCLLLETLDLSGWDVSSLTDASEMFRSCGSIRSIGMARWQTSSLANVDGMFQGCVSLETLDLSNWDTSSLTNISYMLSGTTSLRTLTLDGWDLSNIDRSDGVFSSNSSSHTPLKTFNINNGKLINILGGNRTNSMLWNVYNSVETINARNSEIVDEDAHGLFSYLENLKNIDLGECNTSKVTNAYQMFYNCQSLATLDLSGWDVSKLKNASEMFRNCGSLTSIGMNGWQTSSLENVESMFMRCYGLETLDLSNWDTSKLTNINYMLSGATHLQTLTLDGWDLSKIEWSEGVFSSNSSYKTPLKTFNINNAKLINIIGGNYTNSILWNVYSTVETINARNCVIVDNNVGRMCAYLEKLKNVDLSNWTFSGATTFTNMFRDTPSLVSVNLTGWVIPAGSVTTNMFDNNAGGFTIYYTNESTRSAIMAGNPTLNATWVLQ